MEQKQIDMAQQALAMLLKELFILPLHITDEEQIKFFSEIMLNQFEASFNELYQMIMEDER